MNLLNVLMKEIINYTDKELKQLFQNLSDNQLRLLYPFINDCKSKRECLYEGDYLWKNEKKIRRMTFRTQRKNGGI